MLVISDTTPLNILIRTKFVHILPALYGSVVIPSAVEKELLHSKTPQIVQAWRNCRPPWLDVRQPTNLDLGVGRHAGERESICLAVELKADLLLTCGLAMLPKSLGLRITGTLGIIELAARRNVVNLRDAVERVRTTDFFLAGDLIEAALARDAASRPAPG